MKTCQSCQCRFDSADWVCPHCFATPPLVDGHRTFAPALDVPADGFDEDLFATLASLEAGNFWFRNRNRLIVWALRRYFSAAQNMLEIGCGTGFVLAGIAATLPALRLTGSELFVRGLSEAARRGVTSELVQMDARRIPFVSEFDVIGAFDVLEHIDEDEVVLSQAFRALRPGGGLLLTVPNHPWMWSAADEYSHHRRRYTLAELNAKVTRCGFTVVRATAFTSFLFPLMVLSRTLQRVRKGYTLESELRIGGVTNRCLESVLAMETRLIANGITFGFGGSILLAAMRPD